MRKFYVYLPYRGMTMDPSFATMVAAQGMFSRCDGDMIEVTCDDVGKPVSFELVQEQDA